MKTKRCILPNGVAIHHMSASIRREWDRCVRRRYVGLVTVDEYGTLREFKAWLGYSGRVREPRLFAWRHTASGRCRWIMQRGIEALMTAETKHKETNE